MKYFLMFLLLMPSLAYSELISSDNQAEIIDDFSGGMITNVASLKLNKQFATLISNYLTDEEKGKLVKIKGYDILGATITLSKINFMYKFTRQNQQDEFLISDSSIVLTTKDFNSYTLVRNLLNTGSLIQAAQVRDKIWFTNGSDSVFTYDGSTVAVLDGRVYSGTPTPFVPKGKYIVYDTGIVWVFNSTTSESAAHFCNEFSTDGSKITPDNSLAWPVENQLNINFGDGFPITSAFSFDGLYIGKENGIYRIVGQNADTYGVIKTKSEVGPLSNDSVVLGDNLVYFFNKNGIYKFNGSDSIEISYGIKNEIDSVSANATRIVNSVWTENADFNRGSFYGSTVNVNTLYFSSVTSINKLTKVTDFTYHTFTGNNVSTFTGYIPIDGSLLNNQKYFNNEFHKYTIPYRYNPTQPINDVCQRNMILEVDLKNITTGVSTRSTVDIDRLDLNFTPKTLQFNANDLSLTSSDILNSNLHYKLSVNFKGSGQECIVEISSIGAGGNASLEIKKTTGQFVSEITTATSFDAWDKFNGEQILNGGNINYFVRTATSVTNIINKAWNPTNFGAVINSPSTDVNAQWASTFTLDTAEYQYVDFVTLSRIEGGILDTRPIGKFWKNRLWLSVSTITNSSNNVIWLKAKEIVDPNSFVRIDGINLRAMLTTSDVFYAGSSTAGVILRLDFGDTFNGSAIPAVYERDMLLSSLFFKKELSKYFIQTYSVVGNSLKINISADGNPFLSNMISPTSGIYFNKNGINFTELNNPGYRNGTYFKFRLEDSNINRDTKIGMLGIYYKNTLRF